MKKFLLGLITLGIMSVTAQAGCQCMCVNNQKQWVCSNSLDIPVGFCDGWCSGYKSQGPVLDLLSSNQKISEKSLLVSSIDKTKLNLKK